MITVTTPPAGEPVSPAELKAHLRVTHDAEDELIAALIGAARERVEAAVGLCLLATGLSQTGAAGPDGALSLLRGPLLGVDAVLAGDGAGGWTALAPSAYRVEGGRSPPRVRLGYGPPGPVRIDYRAGFGADPSATPAGLRQALLTVLADAYERRGDGEAPSVAAADAWLAPFRMGRL